MKLNMRNVNLALKTGFYLGKNIILQLFREKKLLFCISFFYFHVPKFKSRIFQSLPNVLFYDPFLQEPCECHQRACILKRVVSKNGLRTPFYVRGSPAIIGFTRLTRDMLWQSGRSPYLRVVRKVVNFPCQNCHRVLNFVNLSHFSSFFRNASGLIKLLKLGTCSHVKTCNRGL